MATPLIVNVIELLRWPGTTKDIEATIAVADLEFDDDAIVGDEVSVGFHLESMSNGISVRGRAHAHWSGSCRRCAAPVSSEMVVEMEELYQRDPNDPDAYPITNDQIDLVPMVREHVLLSVPLAPLCRPDCPGLCPLCGIDRAEAQCDCSDATLDPRWAVLDALREGNDSERM